jgi:hypothetical protein
VNLMDGTCFIKMHAFSWKVLDPVKEVLSLNFEPAIKSKSGYTFKELLVRHMFFRGGSHISFADPHDRHTFSNWEELWMKSMTDPWHDNLV